MQSTWKHLGAFFLLALATLFFVSPNSYTHDLFDQYDTAWFFTCGKAWMCGMTPYVDFADSKGPLLWLIYGVGYLLSPYNYIGVFWLSVLAYTGVFYYVFSIARLFLTDDRKSYLVTVLMLLSYFCPWFHYEVRAEDWCQIFIAMSFYYCCRWLYADQAKAPKKGYQACFVLGVSLAGTLLIKYTITAMLGIVAIYMLYVIIRQRLNLFFSFLSLLSGFALVTLPFVIYMLLVGNFGAFIQEYFLNTLQTVQSSNSAGTYLREWLKLTGDARFAILFIIGCVGTYLMGEMVEKDKYFFFVSFLAFYAIAIHHCDDIIPYYLCACLLFPLFFIIPIVSITEISLRFRKRLFAFSFCATIFANAFSHGWLLSVWFFRDNDARADYY